MFVVVWFWVCGCLGVCDDLDFMFLYCCIIVCVCNMRKLMCEVLNIGSSEKICFGLE